MNFKSFFLAITFMILFTACSSNSSDETPQEVIENPIATTLIFPEDNTECNEGTILSETQSKVVFRWSISEQTDSYEVILKNIETNSSANYESNTNSKEITIDRGVSYEWHVISKSSMTDVVATSTTYQFFNAGPGVITHVPFSAEVIIPVNESIISSPTGKVSLLWEALDLDNDIKDYEVFYGTNKDQLLSIGIVTTNTVEVNVSSDTAYFWKVKTQDESQNTSISEVFNFKVQ